MNILDYIIYFIYTNIEILADTDKLIILMVLSKLLNGYYYYKYYKIVLNIILSKIMGKNAPKTEN